jgi:hypothetical protein
MLFFSEKTCSLKTMRSSRPKVLAATKTTTQIQFDLNILSLAGVPAAYMYINQPQW